MPRPARRCIQSCGPPPRAGDSRGYRPATQPTLGKHNPARRNRLLLSNVFPIFIYFLFLLFASPRLARCRGRVCGYWSVQTLSGPDQSGRLLLVLSRRRPRPVVRCVRSVVRQPVSGRGSPRDGIREFPRPSQPFSYQASPPSLPRVPLISWFSCPRRRKAGGLSAV